MHCSLYPHHIHVFIYVAEVSSVHLDPFLPQLSSPIIRLLQENHVSPNVLHISLYKDVVECIGHLCMNVCCQEMDNGRDFACASLEAILTLYEDLRSVGDKLEETGEVYEYVGKLV